MACRWLAALVLVACTDPAAPMGEDTDASTGAPSSATTLEPGTTGDGTTRVETTSSSSSSDSDDTASSSGSAESESSTGAIACADALVLDETFEIDPAGVTTQIQASVLFDPVADGVWVVYNLPADDGLFDVHVARLHCDGTHQVEPRRINTTEDRNDIDGELARVGDDLLVVWASDDGVSPVGNIQILAMGLDGDGNATFADDVILQTSFDGEPVLGSAWMPHLRADDDAFVLVGTRGIDSAFRIFVQRLDAQAGLVGDAIAPPDEPGVGHDTVDAAVLDNGDLAIAWAGTDDSDASAVRLATVIDDTFVPDMPPLLVDDDASGPAVATDPTGAGAYVAASVEDGAGRTIQVSRAQPGDDATPVVLGDGFAYAPSLATGPTGAGVAWYRNTSGIHNELWVARVVDDGDTLGASAEQAIPDADAAPYASTITRVVDDVYFVAWSQGVSPDLRLYGRFVDLGD